MLRMYRTNGRWVKYEYRALMDWWWQGKLRYCKTSYPSGTLCTINPRSTALGTNMGLCSNIIIISSSCKRRIVGGSHGSAGNGDNSNSSNYGGVGSGTKINIKWSKMTATCKLLKQQMPWLSGYHTWFLPGRPTVQIWA